MNLTHPARRELNATRNDRVSDVDGDVMNTVADSTRTHRTTVTAGTRAASLRSSARRLAGWWAADPMSASFSAARERDQRLLGRVGR
jgi:hypothetical protein